MRGPAIRIVSFYTPPRTSIAPGRLRSTELGCSSLVLPGVVGQMEGAPQGWIQSSFGGLAALIMRAGCRFSRWDV